MLEFARCNAEKIHGLCSAGILPAVPRASRPRRVRAGRPHDSRRDGGATLNPDSDQNERD